MLLRGLSWSCAAGVNHDWLHLYLETACFVAVADANTYANADNDWGDNEEHDGVHDSISDILSCLVPFGVEFVPGCIDFHVVPDCFGFLGKVVTNNLA